MQQLFRMRDAEGNDYDVPASDMNEFRGAVPNATAVTRHRGKDGMKYDVPEADTEEFRGAVPDASPMRRIVFANGSQRDFTMPEMSEFLRSEEWRKDPLYAKDREETGEGNEQGSPAWAAIKGALSGAASGFWQGGNAAANAIAKAIPEIGVSIESALGNALNLGGNAPNAVGNWFLADAKGGKEWLDRNLPSEAKEWVGYEDWSTKASDKFAEVSATAYKFAPAMASGGSSALINTIFASDGINAAADTYQTARDNGFTPSEANAAAGASFLINYFGAKAITKAGGVAENVSNPLLRFMGQAAATGNVMGTQGAANQALGNIVTGQPITEGLADAYNEGQFEGVAFHAINTLPGAVVGAGGAIQRARETREIKNYLRDNLMDAAKREGGGEFLDSIMPREGVDAAIKARADGKDVSRKQGTAAGLPDNMSVGDRNAIVDAIADSRRGAAQRPKLTDEQSFLLDDTIKETVGEGEIAQRVRERVTAEVKSPEDINDPAKRQALIEKAAKELEAERAKPAEESKPAETRQEKPAEAAKPVAEGEKPAEVAKPTEPTEEGPLPSFLAPEEGTKPAETKKPVEKVPNGKGKMVEKEMPAQTSEKAPTSASSQTPTTTPPKGAEGKETPSRSADAIPKTLDELKAFTAKKLAEAKERPEAPRGSVKELEKFVEEQLGQEFKWTEESVHNFAKDFLDDLNQQAPDPNFKPIDYWKSAEKPATKPIPDKKGKMTKPKAETPKKVAKPPKQEVEEASPYTPSKELAEAKARIEAMSTDNAQQKGAKKKAQKDWLLSSVDDAIKSHNDTRTLEGKSFAEKFADNYETLIKRRNATYKRESLNKIEEQIDKAGETLSKGKMITFDVPDNGTFKVHDNPEALTMFKRLVQKRLSPTSLKEGTIASAERPLAKDIEETGIGKKVVGGKKNEPILAARNIELEPEPATKDPKSSLQRIPDIDPASLKTPEQSIEERLDLTRLDPKRRSDPKVLAWAKKRGRTVTDGKVTPDAVREYDEAMTVGVARLAKHWFPDMPIVVHKFGEKIKRGVHVLEQKLDTPKARAERDSIEALHSIADGKPYGILHNEKYGEIQYPLGKIGETKQSGKAKGGFGFLHIVSERMKKDGTTLEEAIDIARRVGIAAEIGKETKSVMNTHWLDHDGVRAIIAITKDGKPIITGYEIRADVDSAAFPPSKSLQSRPLVREGDIVAALKNNTMLSQRAEKVNGGGEKSYLRDTAGNVLGWFDPKAKEVHLLPGADPKTVAHEIMWHGTRDYISRLAAKGDKQAQKFLDMMHDVEKNIPESLKRQIIQAYTGGTKAPTADVLMNEFGAWFTMGKGGAALERALASAEGRNWFARAFHAVKEMYKTFLSKHGMNRVDLAEVDGMTRDEFVEWLSKQFAGGKTLGNIKESSNELSTTETRFQKLRRRLYDNNAAVRDLERDIEKKTGRKISADDSVEAANALKYGLKEAANIEMQNKMKDFRTTLGENGLHHQDFEYYAALKAAAGRDAKVDKRNIDKLTADLKAEGATPDEIANAIAAYQSTNGSHIDPREAKRMIAEIENGFDGAKYKAAYAEFRKLVDEVLDTQVAAGLVDKAAAEQWRKEEPFYIPFKNEYDPTTGEWMGRGSSQNFVRAEHHTAKGRQSAAGDIIAHVFMDLQSAKHRAIENSVRQKLAALVKANPELGTVEALKPDAVRNVERDNPNAVVFKEGGRSYAIKLEGTRGEAVANAFTQRNLLKMDWADKGFSVFGRKITARNFAHWSSGMATRYSLTFSARNTLKDNIELANIVYSERGPVEGTKFMARYVANRGKMIPTLLKYITTGKIDTTTEGGKMLDSYVKAGGLIAGGVRSEAAANIKEKLSPKSIEREMRRGRSKIAAAARHTLNSVAYLNEYAELATRVGVFAAEVSGGKSAKEAALFSRRATVDFNRHGDWTPAFNLYRLFSNSTLGATARATVALTKSKYGIGMAGVLFANGLARALIEHYHNEDEDKIRAAQGKAVGKDVSEFDRKSSLMYFRSGDKVYKIAEHESPFSFISYAGDCIGRWICGEITGEDAARNLGITAAELAYNFLPMGQVNFESSKGGFVEDMKAAIVSGIFPSVLQPVAEMAFNMDYKGDAVFKQAFNAHDPKSHNAKNFTPDWAKAAAEGLNKATGGNEGKPGWIDVPPEAIQKMVEGYGKNALRDVSAFYSVGKAIIEGDLPNVDPRNVPFKRDFVRPLDGNDKRFNEALTDYNGDKNEFTKMKPAWSSDERKEYIAKHPWVTSERAKNLKESIQKLRKQEKGFRYVNGKAKPHEWPQEKLDEFKEKRRKLQADFIKRMGR